MLLESTPKQEYPCVSAMNKNKMMRIAFMMNQQPLSSLDSTRWLVVICLYYCKFPKKAFCILVRINNT